MAELNLRDIPRIAIDKPVLTYGIIFSILFSYILYSGVGDRHLYVFLIGLGLGISLFQAAFGFTGGWRNFIENEYMDDTIYVHSTFCFCNDSFKSI